MVCSQALLLLWGCWMHVLAWLCLKRAGVSITRSFKMVWSQLSLWRTVWLTYMQIVGASTILGECSTRCHLKMWSLGASWYWDMWNVGKGRRHYDYLSKCNRKMCGLILLPGAVFQFCRNGQCSWQWSFLSPPISKAGVLFLCPYFDDSKHRTILYICISASVWAKT